MAGRVEAQSQGEGVSRGFRQAAAGYGRALGAHFGSYLANRAALVGAAAGSLLFAGLFSLPGGLPDLDPLTRVAYLAVFFLALWYGLHEAPPPLAVRFLFSLALALLLIGRLSTMDWELSSFRFVSTLLAIGLVAVAFLSILFAGLAHGQDTGGPLSHWSFCFGLFYFLLSLAPAPSLPEWFFLPLCFLAPALLTAALFLRAVLTHGLAGAAAWLLYGLIVASLIGVVPVVLTNPPQTNDDLLIFREVLIGLAGRAALIVAVVLAALELAARFVDRLYAVNDLALTRRRVAAQIFPLRTLTLRVNNGVIAADDAEGQAVRRMGGPAEVVFTGLSTDARTGEKKNQEPNGGAALELGGAFTRTLGPARGRLAPFERVTVTFDSRSLCLTGAVRAVTRDGIPVRTRMEVSFRLRMAESRRTESKRGAPGLGTVIFNRISRWLQWGDALPPAGQAPVSSEPCEFSREAAVRAIFPHVLYQPAEGPSTELDWSQRLHLAAKTILQAILSDCTFSELIEATVASEQDGMLLSPHSRIQTKLDARLRHAGRQMGAELLIASVDRVEVDPVVGTSERREITQLVNEQKLEGWRARRGAREQAARRASRGAPASGTRSNGLTPETELILVLAYALNESTARASGKPARYRAQAVEMLDDLGRYVFEKGDARGLAAVSCLRDLFQ